MMTPEEMEARAQQAEKLAENISKFVVAQKVQTDVAAVAFMNLLTACIGDTFDEQTADDFSRMLADFIASRIAQQHEPEEKRFWNLLAEKDYDKPVAFPKEKARAALR
jgi:hypothetical protein